MFDSVLHRGAVPKGRLGTGAAVSFAAHVFAISLVVWQSSRPSETKRNAAEVTFFAPSLAPAPPPPPPPPPLGGPRETKVEKVVPKEPVKKKPDTIYDSVEPPKPREPEPPPRETGGGQLGGVDGGVPGGELGGTLGGEKGGKLGGQLGGTLGGTGTAAPQNAAIPFGAGMERPKRLPGGREITYSREAREARVEGTVMVQCVITTAGTLTGCRIVRSLPFMDRAVLDAVSTWRFTPVTYQGRPVNVQYVIPVKLVLQ